VPENNAATYVPIHTPSHLKRCFFISEYTCNEKAETHHTKTMYIIKYRLLMVVNIKVVAFLDVTKFGFAEKHLWHGLVWHLPDFMESYPC